MNVELLISDPSGTKAYIPVVEEGIEWSTERRSTPGKLTFKLVKDSVINFQEGAAVRLKVDGKPVFFGFVFTKKRDKDQIIEVTAYDQLRYLNNKDTYVYENKTASQFIQMIAADFSLNTGTLEDTGFVIASRVEDNTSLFDMIENALDLTLQNSKEMFVLYDDFGKLTLKNLSSMYVGEPGALATPVLYPAHFGDADFLSFATRPRRAACQSGGAGMLPCRAGRHTGACCGAQRGNKSEGRSASGTALDAPRYTVSCIPL